MKRWLLCCLWLGGAHAAVIRVAPDRQPTPQAAILQARAKPGGEPTTITFAPGVYELDAPLTLTPADSGLTLAAAGGGPVVLSGGRRLQGWTVRDGIWQCQLPAGLRPRSLFVNGRRATLCRAPNTGFYRVAGYDAAKPKQAFSFHPGELAAWPDLADATVVVYHSWETSLLPVAQVDEAAHKATLAGDCVWNFGYWGTPQRWYVEGAAETFDAPGEWHLDRTTGLLRYRPLPGETLATTTVVAPALVDLVKVGGAAQVGLWADGITFRGLTFAHADWSLEPTGHSDPQAACTIGGNLELRSASNCRFEDCTFTHLGRYALALREATRGCVVRGCEFDDIGAGAVRLGETTSQWDFRRSEGHVVDNNWVHHYGQVYAGGVGLWIAIANDCQLTHNEISDGPYTGISAGWDWGRNKTSSHNNLIGYNHIHHIVNGLLSDAGGIYVLGECTGSQIRGNVIHDVFSHTEPRYSWGIYLDAESHGFVVEDNLVYRVQDGLMLHNGAYDNVVANNVFADAVDHLIWRSPATIPQPNTYEGNVALVSQGTLFYYDGKPDTTSPCDKNVYWRSDGQPLVFMDGDLADWQKLGLDRHSVVADPALPPLQPGVVFDDTRPPLKGSAFRGFDTRLAGVQAAASWSPRLRAQRWPHAAMPAARDSDGPQLLDTSFEAEAVGGPPPGLAVSLGEVAGGRVEVSAERAATGAHSLAVWDAAGLRNVWDPHCFYEPRLREGVASLRVKLWVGQGALPWVEWRSGGYPYQVGPSLKVDAGGQFSANDKVVATVPREQWLTLELTCGLGKAATGDYGLKLAVGGEPLRDLGRIPCDPAFKRLGWLGFIALADAKAVFFLDDLRLTIAP